MKNGGKKIWAHPAIYENALSYDSTAQTFIKYMRSAHIH